MAFKMKGSAFKLNNVATKSALKQTSPMKYTGEYIDTLDELGNVVKTKRVVSERDKYAPRSREHLKGGEFYEKQRARLEELQTGADEGLVSGDEAIMSKDAGGKEFKQRRRLTGKDLEAETIRNVIEKYESKGEEMDWNDPEIVAAKQDYEKYKEDNPDTWKQDLAIYHKREGLEDYDVGEIPSNIFGPGTGFAGEDKALKADLGKGSVASKSYLTGRKFKGKSKYDPEPTDLETRTHRPNVIHSPRRDTRLKKLEE